MSKTPWRLIEMVNLSSSISSNMSAVVASGAAIAKSSTWHLNITRLPLIIPKYKHGSCTVGVSPSSLRIESSCFSHRRGDSGCPCIANRMGMTWFGGIGGCFLCLTHHSWNARSGYIESLLRWRCFCKCIGYISAKNQHIFNRSNCIE